MTSLLLLNNFYPVISYRRVRKEEKATNYCARFGHSLWSAISCAAKWLKARDFFSIFFLDSLISSNLEVHETWTILSFTFTLYVVSITCLSFRRVIPHRKFQEVQLSCSCLSLRNVVQFHDSCPKNAI